MFNFIVLVVMWSFIIIVGFIYYGVFRDFSGNVGWNAD